jgi:hypothetical protein
VVERNPEEFLLREAGQAASKEAMAQGIALLVMLVLYVVWGIDLYRHRDDNKRALDAQERQRENFHEMLRQMRRIIRLRERG